MPHPRLELPDGLRNQLHQFRRRVWARKSLEALAAAGAGVMVGFLLVFGLDRWGETPGWVRALMLGLVFGGCAVVPWQLYRWVWRQRQLDAVARLLSRRLPLLGDQLLGVIELVRSDTEQARSPALCAAAIRQVADETAGRDFSAGLPPSRHRCWGAWAGTLLLLVLVLAGLVPEAVGNAWSRFLLPWRTIPRFTFTRLAPLPETLVVAHGEPLTLEVALAEGTVWQPERGTLSVPGLPAWTAELQGGRYRFDLPAPIQPRDVRLHIGDARRRIAIVPLLRPELSGVGAAISLPEYLERTEPQRQDARAGAITLVRGSKARVTATANRPLATARVGQETVSPQGQNIVTPVRHVTEDLKLPIEWEDEHGLTGKAPFLLSMVTRDDEAPSLICEDLPRQKVVLDTEQLTFRVRARDDFGVRRVGLEWRSLREGDQEPVERGERLLAAGGPEADVLELTGTFSAHAFGIDPQAIELRVWAEDYFPGRPRVYSQPFVLYVLAPDQHAMWLTEQLSKWHRQSLEVRDRELQLYETNKQLRAVAADELDRPETRRRIEAQAAAERDNGKRLAALTAAGEELVRQATRNPEFGVGHLEQWAEMLQILQDISASRMPSVADLLQQAARAPEAAESAKSQESPQAGEVRAAGGGSGESESPEDSEPAPSVPRVMDVESTQQPEQPDQEAAGESPESPPTAPRLTLAETTLLGTGGSSSPPPPAAEKMDEAIQEQADLLAEFERVAEELNRVLANLEGSTLVKRLKAAARRQYEIAGQIGEYIDQAFGLSSGRLEKAPAALFGELGELERQSSRQVSQIMDDMEAFFERRRFVQFKAILDEMRAEDVVGSLRQLGDDLEKESGLSLAQCEFWSDTLDRWAEDLVDPASDGSCPGGKSAGSLPPSIVLEVLQILEGEVNLREETRVAEQTRPLQSGEDYRSDAVRLSEVQEELRQRTEEVTQRILELPQAEESFGRELELLAAVEQVMRETVAILARPETGPAAIAAETEAIELLLQSRRINPRGGGGGGGAMPGGGGGGTTEDSALALLGRGRNEQEVREDRGVTQATGDTGRSLPEEFRSGLDQYFSRLEQAGVTFQP